jgi:PTS system nitrogen regulatory IIA component
MTLSDILRPEAVKVVSETLSKKRLFQKIGDVAHDVYGCMGARCAEALIDREALGPTGVGHGVALPHARLHGIDRVRGLFFKLEHPIEFDAVDRQPVDLVFALIAPEEAGVHHLKALALVSRTMRDAGTCAKLRANHEADTLHTVLTEAQATAAA